MSAGKRGQAPIAAERPEGCFALLGPDPFSLPQPGGPRETETVKLFSTTDFTFTRADSRR